MKPSLPRAAPAAADRPPEPEADQYWDWCQQGELRIQRCADCGHWVYFPAPRCHRCLSERLLWTRVSGVGVVYTATVVHHALTAASKAKLPYVVAWVEIPEQDGLRVLANIIGCPPGEVRIGQSVVLEFGENEAGQKVPVFRPLAN